MKTFVLIVNFRTAELVVNCLVSLESQRDTLNGGKAIVIDNSSGDGSTDCLRQALAERQWHAWVEMLEMPRNGGFSYGNNAGMRHARELAGRQPHHVLLLNPDAILKPACLAQALEFLETHPRAGIVGAPIENGAGQQEASAHRWPSPVSELLDQARLGLLSRMLSRWDISIAPTTDAVRCDWISGAFFLIRDEVLHSVGLMDEGYFLYFEEVDYCRRASSMGWEVWQAPCTGIVHLEGASTGIRDPRRPRASYWFDSRRRFMCKTYGWTGLWASDVMSLLGRLTYRIRQILGLGAAAQEDLLPMNFHSMLIKGDLRSAWRELFRQGM